MAKVDTLAVGALAHFTLVEVYNRRNAL